MVYNLLRWDFFTLYNSLEMHPGCCIYQVCSFLLPHSIPWCSVPTTVCLAAEGRLDCFQFGAVMNEIVVNIHVLISA